MVASVSEEGSSQVTSVAQGRTTQSAWMPSGSFSFIIRSFIVLLIEDMIIAVVLMAMILMKLIDRQFVGPPMVLLCLRCIRGACLMVPLALQEASIPWPAPLVLSAAMAIASSLLQFNQPFEFLTYVLLAQAAASTIQATYTCCLVKQLQARQQEASEKSSDAGAISTPSGEVLQAQDLDLEDGSMCVICLSAFHEDETVMRLTCGHVHHDTCIRAWFAKGKGTCPLRCNLKKSQVVLWQTDNLVAF